jgi:ribosome-binding ATPase
MEAALALLRDGRPARLAYVAEDDRPAFAALNLLTSKRVVYVCNVEEASAATGNAYSDQVVEKVARAHDAPPATTGGKGKPAASPKPPAVVVISAAIESEIAQLERRRAAGVSRGHRPAEPGLDRLIRTGYELLDLVTFFTTGPKETRAWTVPKGTKAPQAAGAIHTDFERGFIRAQTIAYEDFVALGGETGAKEAGKARDEGKEYVVQDGDVMLFKFNV